MNIEHIAAVTDQLARALTQVSTVLRVVDRNTKKLNDRDNYNEITTLLEALTVATLSATSSMPLVNVQPTGARFNIAAGTELARQVSEAVSYLRNDASNLLRSGGFSQHERKHVDIALGYLHGLYGLITDGIARQARKDMEVLLQRGPDALILAAEHLARAAILFIEGKQPENARDEQWNPAG